MPKLGLGTVLVGGAAVIIGFLVYLTSSTETPDPKRRGRTAAESSDEDDAPRADGLMPTPESGRRLGIAASNFLKEDASQKDEAETPPDHPVRPDEIEGLGRNDRKMAEKFGSGNLSRLARGMVMTGANVTVERNEPTPSEDPATESGEGGGR